ncbi:hypothetical protein QZH41_008191, partial [Actinostola sp. cb2023]
CFSGEYHITLDPTVPPVVHPPRRVPEALREPLRKELEYLVKQEIIANSKLPFFGHIISAEGLKLDPGKVEAINNMDPSTSLADLQTFLGMTQFLSRFITNLAATASILWDLTRKSSDFQWCPEHQSAVEQIKKLISSLQYFDGTKPVVIQVDASQRGLGATLLQDKGPVEYR